MKSYCLAITLLLSLVLPAAVFGQSGTASLSGTVTDASGAVMPDVAVTATNTATGVVNKAVSNSAGIYSFPSLLPGKYKVTAEMPGFQTQTFTDVQLGNAAQIRLNCKLQLAGIQQAVEVSIEAERLILDSSSSTGDVLAEQAVQELPQVNNNALDMVRVMSGYVPTGTNAVFNANDATVGGVSVGNLNLKRDGVDVSDVRYPSGIKAPTQINPDLVGEFRMILSPVDAEMGRGNAQVQVLTRSGTNEYHGSVVWDVQNSAIDSNQWYNNRSNVTPPWRNLHQYTFSFGGPIIKNKTFFFALYNGQIARLRDAYNPIVLTPCARKGIFRYFDGWNNGRYGQATTTAATPTTAVVDLAGNPVAPTTNPDGTAFAGSLHYASVFGTLLKTPQTNDCSDFNPATDVAPDTNWDTYRTAKDATGYIDNFLSLMPEANNYDTLGDGLNTAGGRWMRGTRGADNMFGIGEDSQRKQINLKVDHVINASHRLSGSWSYESNWADNNFKVWPDGFGGRTERRPQVFTVNYTATLTPTLLNEARFGVMRTGNNGYFPLENPETGKELLAMLPQVNNLPLVVSPGTGGAAFSVASSNFFGGRGGLLGWTNRDFSPRWTYADTLTWVKNKHSFKIGAELRFNRTKSTVYGTNWGMNANPYAVGGDAQGLAVQGINSTNMPGLAGNATTGSQLLMQNLLTFLSGSLGSVSQAYFINSSSQESWNDPLAEKEKIRDIRQREVAVFFKDDWKIHDNLTLNLGLRYEYYGVPYLKNGLTAALDGGSSAAFGISGRSFEEGFWNPGARADLSQLIFIGPGSPNPDRRVYNRDLNNFGPAIGFAWQLPWFGKGKTTLRGGYQISYVGGGQTNTTSEGIIANPPGSTASATYTPNNVYLNLENVADVVPVPTTATPMSIIPLTDRTQSISAYDNNFRTPYIQNLTMAVTRNIGRNLTVDVRYVGTLTRKNTSMFNINTPNFLTNGLLEAFNAARYGDDSNPATQLLDQIFAPVRGSKSGAAYLRTSTRGVPQVRNMLANANYSGLATAISNWANPNAAKGVTDNGWLLRTAGFPENFIVSNPQFSAVNLYTNLGTANYHSMQAQVTMRPTAGVSFQVSYTWSKNLGITGAGFTDPRDRAADYTVLGSDRPHVVTSYGTFDLPLGPNRLLFGKSSGILARFFENWQASWIANFSSGSPANITAQSTLYGTGVPDQVGPFPHDKVGVSWKHGAYQGNYFDEHFTYVDDPQKANVTSADNLRNFVTLTAVADADGNIILQNPLPGKRGNFGFNRIYGPGTWNADIALSKSVKIAESKSLQVRVDATNIFNHPQPGGSNTAASTRISFATAPLLSILSSSNSNNPFGYLGSKVGQRTFQARLRFSF